MTKIVRLGGFVVVAATWFACGGDDDDDVGSADASGSEPTSEGMPATPATPAELAPEMMASDGAAPTASSEMPAPMPPLIMPSGRSIDLAEATVRIVIQSPYAEPFAEEVVQGVVSASGTGFIIDPSGLAVTNHHVVANASTVEVFMGEPPRRVSARIVAVSECNDLAVIDLDGDGYQYFEWYTGAVERGMLVQSVGFPLGDPQLTQTQGIVAKSEAPEDTSWSSISSVFEHDARINGGNSGGPLILANGDPVVLGVNYAGDTETDQNLAISVNAARPIVEILRTGQNVDTLGIRPEAILTESGATGVGVYSVGPGSPADRAGILPGDIITSLASLTPAPDGTLAYYCQVVRTQGQDGVIPIEVLRRQTGEVLVGQFNGEPLVVTETAEDTSAPTTPPPPADAPPAPPPSTPSATCSDACAVPSQVANGFCNDGSNGDLALCDPGTDCTDCGEGANGCTDTCSVLSVNGDGDCDDGGPDSDFDICELGTDCTDCGDRATP